jgi:hypothetical protein
MNNNRTLEGKISTRITRTKSPVLMREDFKDLGGYDQVGRVLQALIKKRKLIRIGYGLYAKAKISRLTGNTVPVEPLPALAKSALNRLGVTTLPSYADLAYQEGRSTQVPTGRLIGMNKLISRKIGYNNATIYYEHRPHNSFDR